MNILVLLTYLLVSIGAGLAISTNVCTYVMVFGGNVHTDNYQASLFLLFYRVLTYD